MVDQTLALQVQRPKFDYYGAVQQAQDIRGKEQSLESGEIKGALQQMELEDTTRERGALNSYRDAREAGDPKAMGKLAAYPELQAKFHQAIESMKPDERKAALDRSRSIGEAARYVASFPEGSPERAAAWEKSVDGLVKSGYIPPEVGEQYKKGGPSDLILDQALAIDDWIQKYAGDSSGKVDASTAAIEKGVADFRETVTPKEGYLDEEQAAQIEARVEAERKRLEKLYAKKGSTLGGDGGSPGRQDREAPKSQDRVGAQPPDDLVPPSGKGPAPTRAKPPGSENVGIGTIIRSKSGQRKQWDGETWVDIK